MSIKIIPAQWSANDNFLDILQHTVHCLSSVSPILSYFQGSPGPEGPRGLAGITGPQVVTNHKHLM